MQSPLAENARFFNASPRFVAVCAALLFGGTLALGSMLAPTPASALSALTCGPEYSTVDEVRESMPATGPRMIDLSADETDRYLAWLGRGRPANSHGMGSVLVVVPHKGVLLGMTDGPNMCSPYLRVSHMDHQKAMDAAMGMGI